MTFASDFALQVVAFIAIIYLAVFIIGPIWLASVYLFYDIFLEYLIVWLGLLGIPAGTYFYFQMCPEDLQKVKDFLHSYGVI